jgi:hypothetical protein
MASDDLLILDSRRGLRILRLAEFLDIGRDPTRSDKENSYEDSEVTRGLPCAT